MDCVAVKHGTSDEEIIFRRKQNKEDINSNKDYANHFSHKLDCDIYLYKDDKIKRSALLFHFKSYFDITIEGITTSKNKITHMEKLGLPDFVGNYYKLTESPVKCRPFEVVTYASEKNRLNETNLTDSDQWIFQALSTLKLDSLVQKISAGQYEESYRPIMEKKPTWYAAITNKVSDFYGYANKKIETARDALEVMDKPQEKPKKIPVELPHISEPHVLSEYDSKIRPATVIRITTENQSGWGLLFHFYQDDSFRTVKGVWHNNILMPSIEKKRPDDKGQFTFLELGDIEISPAIIKELALNNPLNGAKQGESNVTEITEWAKLICEAIDFIDKWDSSLSWEYVAPAAYTVAPNRRIFRLPFSIAPSSRYSS